MAIRLFDQYFKLPLLLMGLGEMLIFLTSAYMAIILSFGHSFNTTGIDDHQIKAFGFSLVMLVNMLAMGLYQARLRPRITGVLLRVILSYVFGGIILVSVIEAFPNSFPNASFGRDFILFAIGISFIGVCLSRYAFLFITDSEVMKRRIIVYGSGKRANFIEQRLRRKSDRYGCEIVGYVYVDGDGNGNGVAANKLLHLGGMSLSEYARQNNIHEIVEGLDNVNLHFPGDELLKCKGFGVRVIRLQTFFEREVGFTNLHLLTHEELIYENGFIKTIMQRLLKRFVDVAASAVVLLLTWPIMLLTAIAILVESKGKGPVLYVQKRVGLHGDVFSIFKFRSMKTDAEQDGKAVWATKDDQRITKVGRFIRKCRIDELPQLFNVLNGSMSFVGPRPERPEIDKDLIEQVPYYSQRYQLKPGITGWAQLCYPYGANLKDVREKLQFDLFYAKKQSILFDIAILIQTVEVILFGKGAR